MAQSAKLLTAAIVARLLVDVLEATYSMPFRYDVHDVNVSAARSLTAFYLHSTFILESEKGRKIVCDRSETTRPTHRTPCGLFTMIFGMGMNWVR